MQVEELQQQYPLDEINAVRNSFQAMYKIKKSVDVQTEDEDVFEAQITQWQELGQHDTVKEGRSKNLLIVFSSITRVQLLWKKKITIFVMVLIKELLYSSLLIINISRLAGV